MASYMYDIYITPKYWGGGGGGGGVNARHRIYIGPCCHRHSIKNGLLSASYDWNVGRESGGLYPLYGSKPCLAMCSCITAQHCLYKYTSINNVAWLYKVMLN